MRNVLEHINLLKRIFQVERYPEMSGGCLKFHLYLKEFYDCIGWYNNHHILTEINGILYDIRGEVPFSEFEGYYRLGKGSCDTLQAQYEKGGVLSKEDIKLLKKHYKN